jgi:hypothetical protein
MRGKRSIRTKLNIVLKTINYNIVFSFYPKHKVAKTFASFNMLPMMQYSLG